MLDLLIHNATLPDGRTGMSIDPCAGAPYIAYHFNGFPQGATHGAECTH